MKIHSSFGSRVFRATKLKTANRLCGLISGVLLLAAGTPGALAGTTPITGTTGGNAPLENRQPTLGTGYMIAVQGTVPDSSNAGPAGTQPPNRATPFLGEIKAIPFHFAPGGWMLCEGQSLLTAQNTALFNLIGYTFGGSGANFNLPDLRERVPIGAGQGAGLPNYQLGDVVGIKNPVMSVANLPAHTHTLSGGITGSTGSGAPLENRQPSLALHFLIAANGEMMIAPWDREPTGWAHCDGRMLNMANYSYLFSNIGTTYGGNGAPNFALPDLRGRTVIGDDSNFFWPLGLAYGVNENVLSVSAIAAHMHTISGGNTGSTGGPGGTANNYQPSLVMRWMMSLFGAFPTPGNAVSFPMVSEMRLVAGPAVDGVSQDDGWAPLFGQLLNINENDTLYNLIGTTYGGDGQDTFALPNLGARVDAGVSPAFVLGETAGTDALSISVAQLAAHSHVLPTPLALATAVSRKTHGGAGDFDIDILNANFGPECRSSGGNHTLVFTFTNNVTSGNANVTSGGGTVSGSPNFNGNTMTVSLTGVTDVQKITVTLSNVTDSFAQVLPNTAVSMNMLIGDTSGSKTVNGTDVSQTKLQSGAGVSATNFRTDVNAGGSINGTDVSLVKLRSGSGVP